MDHEGGEGEEKEGEGEQSLAMNDWIILASMVRYIPLIIISHQYYLSNIHNQSFLYQSGEMELVGIKDRSTAIQISRLQTY